MHPGVRLAYLRRKCGMTQKEVAKALGISRNTLSAYENGKSDIPLTVTLRLARLYEFEFFDVFAVHESLEGVKLDTSIYEVIKTYARCSIMRDIKAYMEMGGGDIPKNYYEMLYREQLRQLVTSEVVLKMCPTALVEMENDKEPLF